MAGTSDPFVQLRGAYASRDAAAAARNYTADAEVIYRYDGSPQETYVGTDAIQASFQALFDQVDPSDHLDLNFRETSRDGSQVSGVYRLRIGGNPASYGRFETTLTVDAKFENDVSSNATLEEFEDASGPVMIAPADEVLERAYYGQLTGRYRKADGCDLVVTRSVVRLFVRDTCTGEWRGLTRLSGREWTAGDRVISNDVSSSYRFAPIGSKGSPSVDVVANGETVTAERHPVYRTEEISFTSADGTELAGTLYLPNGHTGSRPGMVMLHGSGPQDRDGFASIIAVLADQVAASGRVVLTFDKRGSGASDGDGDRAGFDQLAADAIAAMSALAARPEVDPARIGLGGSSQAGWVAARAIARGAPAADVLLLGAAGAAVTVSEQNLYNTEVRMRCSGLGDDDVRLALSQQRAFFDYLRDPTNAATLDELTNRAARSEGLRDWLFPDSQNTDRSAGAWYVVLDPTFDPLPVWQAYRGGRLFLFSEHDDSTPTDVAVDRLQSSGDGVRTLAGAQHLGLVAADACKGSLTDVSRFAPGLMESIATFARP